MAVHQLCGRTGLAGDRIAGNLRVLSSAALHHRLHDGGQLGGGICGDRLAQHLAGHGSPRAVLDERPEDAGLDEGTAVRD